jgi:hypothetical protein
MSETNEWQPMETAPKNRNSRLVYCKENLCQFVVYWAGSDGWRHFGSNLNNKLQHTPTHWRELPDAPSEPPQPPPRAKTQEELDSEWIEDAVNSMNGNWVGSRLENIRVGFRSGACGAIAHERDKIRKLVESPNVRLTWINDVAELIALKRRLGMEEG